MEVIEHDGWRIKLYAISRNGAALSPELVEAALAIARQRLPRPAITDSRYGLGFLGVHEGRGENFVFLDWWQQENELHHHVWFSDQTRSATLRPWRSGDPIACVWDLGVIAFERAAWVRHVLANESQPDLAAYLAAQLGGSI